MAELEIREARVEDVAAIRELVAELDGSSKSILPPEKIREVFERIATLPNQVVYVGEKDGVVVAMFMLAFVQQFSHEGRCSAVVQDVAVHSEWQGKGLGRQLSEFAAEKAREHNCYQITLSSGMQRLGAHKFYESMGYERHGHSFLLKLG